MKSKELLQRYQAVMVPNYAPLSVIPASASGCRVTDVEGVKRLDLTGGIAVLGLGHCHPEIVKTLEKQAANLWHVSNYYTTEAAIEMAELLCKETFAESVFFCNSGLEANEAALKLARKYASETVNAEKDQIISFQNSFHGRSLFTVTAGGQEKYREGFGPLPGRFDYAEYNDIESVKGLISDKTCAVIMEPIIAEGGVYPATLEFTKAVRELCDQHNALLIFDEVQTGAGRTGHLFAYQMLAVTPDILTSAKALGSGFPVAAMLTSKEISKVFVPGTHGSTFGANPLAMAVAKKTLELILEPGLLDAVQEKSKLFFELLKELNDRLGFFSEIRGKGLLIGLELVDNWKGKAGEIMTRCLDHGLMVLVAGPNVVRLVPALNITDAEIKEGIQAFESALTSLK